MQGRFLVLISRRLESSTSHLSSLRKFASSSEDALTNPRILSEKLLSYKGNHTQSSASNEELLTSESKSGPHPNPIRPNPINRVMTNPNRDVSLPQVESRIWAVERLGKGKWYSVHDRKKDRIPGYLWEQDTPDVEHVLIVMDKFQIQSIWSRMGEERFLLTIFTLEVFDGFGSNRILYKLPVLPRRINYDKEGNVCNVGFAKVPPGSKFRLDTPIRICGRENCIGLQKGGYLKVHLEYASLFCLPGEVPLRVDIDVKEMDIGDSVCLGDLKLELPLHESQEPSQVICEIIS